MLSTRTTTPCQMVWRTSLRNSTDAQSRKDPKDRDDKKRRSSEQGFSLDGFKQHNVFLPNGD